MELIILPNAEEASRVAARLIAHQVRDRPESILGLATGSTPLVMYRELIRLAGKDNLDFSRVTTFNLDEYVGLSPDHPASYHWYMREHVIGPLGLRPDQVHIPDGNTEDIPGFCAGYERAIRDAGGIDLQVLGIGSDGHIGFNEPTSSLASRTRIKTLTRETVADNARFFKDAEKVPRHVITMGIGTILESRCCLLLAFGEQKAEAVARAVEGPLTALVPASALQLHPHTKVFVDDAAASQLQHRDYYRWVYEGKPDWQQF